MQNTTGNDVSTGSWGFVDTVAGRLVLQMDYLRELPWACRFRKNLVIAYFCVHVSLTQNCLKVYVQPNGMSTKFNSTSSIITRLYHQWRAIMEETLVGTVLYVAYK